MINAGHQYARTANHARPSALPEYCRAPTAPVDDILYMCRYRRWIAGVQIRICDQCSTLNSSDIGQRYQATVVEIWNGLAVQPIYYPCCRRGGGGTHITLIAYMPVPWEFTSAPLLYSTPFPTVLGLSPPCDIQMQAESLQRIP